MNQPDSLHLVVIHIFPRSIGNTVETDGPEEISDVMLDYLLFIAKYWTTTRHTRIKLNQYPKLLTCDYLQIIQDSRIYSIKVSFKYFTPKMSEVILSLSLEYVASTFPLVRL